VFSVIQRLAEDSSFGLYRTLNMGMGLILVVPGSAAADAAAAMAEHGVSAVEIGRVEEGTGIRFT
jgi:phosphoribosylformylglycinamidine cyclo-ligase